MSLLLPIIFASATNTFNLPPGLLSSLCYVESTHNINAIHMDDGGSPSLGLCQVKLKTAKWLGFSGSKEQLMNPSTNAHYAGLYLQYQIKRYHGNLTKAVIAYNRGNSKNLTSSSHSVKVLKQWGKISGQQ